MKNIFKKFSAGALALIAGVGLLSSGWDHYQSFPLKNTSFPIFPVFSLKDNRIAVTVKAMSAEDCKRSFGHDLTSRGVQPVHITVENNTSNEYSLCPSSVDLPRIEPSKVAFSVTKASIPRGIAFRIASLFFWPLAIPSAVDGIYVLAHHKNLKKDLLAKAVKDEIVAPFSTFHRILFVPKDQFEHIFKVTLIELESLQATEFQAKIETLES